MLADGYATTCILLGLESSIELINNMPSLEAFIIYYEDRKLKHWKSDAFPVLREI